MSDGRNLEAHLFVCTNAREKGQSCQAKGSLELRENVKKLCQGKDRDWHGRVRVNTAGCLGRCEEGIAAVLYPQAQWFTGLQKDDTRALETALSACLDRRS